VVEPLPSPNGLVRPGLAQPPPGWGDGLRDSDISGVPGMLGNGLARAALWMLRGLGKLEDELRRRWWCCEEEDSETEDEVEEEAEGLRDARSTDGIGDQRGLARLVAAGGRSRVSVSLFCL
jgi:hypothetical protein